MLKKKEWQFISPPTKEVGVFLPNLDKYNILYIDFSNVGDKIENYDSYIDRIINNLNKDLSNAYPHHNLEEYDTLATKLEATNEEFILIFDEWDYIFNKNLYPQQQEIFLDFLRNLLKGRTYVALCYMTGILPIKKHSEGSALNMFEEYTFLNDVVFSTYFGFTETEVNTLCKQHNISYNTIAEWYNGYTTAKGIKIFNPRSVKIAISDNYCQSYWSNTGDMNEVLKYLKLNTLGVREDIIKMINGESISISITKDYRAGAKTPSSKQEIYSAMVTLGFLSYSNRKLRIPNKELMLEFEDAIKDKSFGELAVIINNANDMLEATLGKDTAKIAKLIHDIHNLEIPILEYNDENSLSCVLTLAYLSARDVYRIEREEKSGKGYVDFIFHPRYNNDIPIVIELKCNKSPKVVLEQIIEKEYVNKLFKQYKQDVLIVGINYDKNTKEHTCAIQQIEYIP